MQADVEQVQEQVQAAELQPVDLVTGSIELLNEVSAGKITGEEERYSRTDLYDIQANVEGSQAAFDALRPVVEERDSELVAEIEERFDAVYETLDPYREGDGWVPYTDVTEEERRDISQSIDALAEPAANAYLPPEDTGEALGLGSSRLTLTFGFGPTLFEREGEDRFGLRAMKPEALADIPPMAVVEGEPRDRVEVRGGDLHYLYAVGGSFLDGQIEEGEFELEFPGA